MQLIVLGMHRSGTSTVTRLLNMAGAYFGPEGISTGANAENPKGFWERRDFREIMDSLLFAAGADWWKVADFDVSDIDATVLEEAQQHLRAKVLELDAHRPWVLKEPRLCLLLPVLRPILEIPICILVRRDPVEVAKSLRARDRMPIDVGLALWERYMTAAMTASAEIRTVQVSYADVMHDPVSSVERMVHELNDAGVRGLRMPSSSEIKAFVSPRLHRQKADAEEAAAVLTPDQLILKRQLDTLPALTEGMLTVSRSALEVLRRYELTRTSAEASSGAKAEPARSPWRQPDSRIELTRLQTQLKKVEADSLGLRRLVEQGQQAALDSARATGITAELRAADREIGHLMAQAEHLSKERDALADQLDARDAEHDKSLRTVLDETARARDEVENVRAEQAELAKKLREAKEQRNAAVRSRSQLENSVAVRVASRSASVFRRAARVQRPPVSRRGAPSSSPRSATQPAGGTTRAAPVVLTGTSLPGSGRPLVAVVSWDMGHNPLGRAHVLAEMLSDAFDVQIIGAQFPRYGSEIWRPLSGSSIPMRTFVGGDYPDHFAAMQQVAGQVQADAIVVSKPRGPSYLLGTLAKLRSGAPMVLDVDDLELSFFGVDDGLPLDEVARQNDVTVPFGKTWTRVFDRLIDAADALSVSNPVLRERYGGTVIPHARDETAFDPTKVNREAMRRRLGVDATTRLLVFGGTPRAHKGLRDIVAALDELDDDRYRLLVMAGGELEQVRREVPALARWAVEVPPVPFEQLPHLLSAADLSCVLQEVGNHVTAHQMPAKITDALAMRVPCLVTSVAPLAELVERGVVAVQQPGEPLSAAIERVFADPQATAARADAGREFFLERMSYAAVRPLLVDIVQRLLKAPPRADTRLAEVVDLHRDLFGVAEDAQDGSTTAAAGRPLRAPIGRRPLEPGMSYDIVMFWKQNDTGIYGRRQDMMLKYLEHSPRVNRIVHFDEPITIRSLAAKYRAGRRSRTDQGGLVFRATVRRLLHRADTRRASLRTYLYSTGGLGERLGLPPREAYPAYVAAVLAAEGMGERPIVFWGYPRNADLPSMIDHLEPDLVLTDLVDDNRTWFTPGSAQHAAVDANYREVLARTEIAIANCDPVAVSMQQFVDRVEVVPNACEWPVDLKDLRPPIELARLRGPIIGYVGNLSSRIDIDLLDLVTAARPEWQFVFVGSTHLDETILRLQDRPNVHFLGVRPYVEAQRFIRNFDVAIIPHTNDVMTQTMNPLKLYVYASLGTPIVSTEVGNLADVRGLRTARGPHAFVTAIEASLAQGKIEPDDAVLTCESWTRRIDTIFGLIDDYAQRQVQA